MELYDGTKANTWVDTGPKNPFTTAGLNKSSHAAVPATAAQMANRKIKSKPSTMQTPEPRSTPTFPLAMFSNGPSPGPTSETRNARREGSPRIPGTNVTDDDQRESKPSLPLVDQNQHRPSPRPESSNLSAETTTGSEEAVLPKGFGRFSPAGSTNGSDSNTSGGFGGFGSRPGTTGSGSGFSAFGSPASNHRSESGSQTSTGQGPFGGGTGFGSITSVPLANGKRAIVKLPKGTETTPGESEIPFPPSTRSISW